MKTAAASKAPIHAWVALGVLMVFYLMSFLDKQIFSLLATLIVKDLHFTDVQLGLLQGFCFSIPYSVGVLITGWAVDKFSRRNLLFLGLFFWSFAAAASGLATSFGSMAMLRAGVGLGEAFLIPAGMSLIATIFPRDRVSGAIGLFYAGASVGGVVALLAGGTIIDALVHMGDVTAPVLGVLRPWQQAFMLTGLPGVAIAFLAFLIRAQDAAPVPKSAAARPDEPGAEDLMPFIRRNIRFLACFFAGMSGMTVCAYTIISWMAPYLDRTFGWSHTVIGLVMATGTGVGGLGNIGWGMACDRLKRRGYPDAVLRLFIPLTLLAIPFSAVAYLVKEPWIFLPAYGLAMIVYNGYGSLSSALQLAVPNHIRGRMTGIQFVIAGLVGLGLGPVVAGFFTEHVFHDKSMLGPAIVCSVTLGGLWAAFWFSLARAPYGRVVAEQDTSAARPGGR